MMSTKTVVFVLGMHRSGTSAMAGTLRLLGLELGEDLMEAQADNIKGFFEHKEVVKINDEILAKHARKWDSMFILPIHWEKSAVLQPYKKRIQRLFWDSLGDSPLILIKDPRLSLTLPIWQEVLDAIGIRHSYVILLRHPLEISQSLAKRDLISTEKTLLMWTHAMFAMEKATRHLPRTFVHFENLLADPASQFSRIAQALGIIFPLEVERVLPEIKAFLTPSLKHHAINPEEVIPQSLLVEEVRQRFRPLASSADDPALLLQIDELHQRWKADVDFFQPVEMEQAFQELWQQREKGGNLAVQIQELAAQKLSQETQQIAHLERLMKEKDQQYAEINALLHLKAQIQAQLDWQIQESAHQALELSSVKDQKHAHEIELQAIRSSLSFRLGRLLTAPMRWLYDGFFVHLAWLARFLLIAVQRPFRVFRQLNLSKIRILLKALGNESPAEILQNFRQLFGLYTAPDLYPFPPQELLGSKGDFTYKKKQTLADFLEKGSPMVFEKNTEPLVSIILVVYNRAELTFACLESLQALTMPFELIIIDNASTDLTHEMLRRVEGIRSVKNTENKGFLRACNQAGALAEGKHILLLNNDAQLLPGSLEAAVDTLESRDDIGAVGGKIILLDGHLQEAGSIIWQDGSCLGYGRGQHPERPEFMFRREVDYVSGVFLLTPKKLFDELGGFDERFLPAYYEETDYCLRLWQAGYRVIYEPAAEVIHFEFGSSEKAEEAIALQQAHQQIFAEKHTATLSRHPMPHPSHIIQARFAAAKSPSLRILLIEDMIPHIDEGSGFPRSNQILWHFHEMGHIISVLPNTFPNKDTWLTAYQDLPREIELLIDKGKEDLPELLRSRANYYDLIWVSRPHNFEVFQTDYPLFEASLGHAQIVYDAEAIFSNRDIAFAQLKGDRAAVSKYQAQLKAELQLGKKADILVAVNETEAQQFREEVDIPTYCINAVFEINPATSPFSRRSGLLFVGNMDYDASPNVDSIQWLVEEVYPYLAKQMEVPELILIGSKKSPKIRALAKAHAFIRLYGRIPNLKPFFEKSRLFVAPTRYGAGSPAKVLQAAAYGIPIVCTELIQDQLGWAQGDAMLAASQRDPKLFADHICRVYESEELSQQLVEGALRELEVHFSREGQRAILEEICHAVINTKKKQS